MTRQAEADYDRQLYNWVANGIDVPGVGKLVMKPEPLARVRKLLNLDGL